MKYNNLSDKAKDDLKDMIGYCVMRDIETSNDGTRKELMSFCESMEQEQQVLNLETMTIEKRYVVTDTKHLLSPIGFDCSQPTYIKTHIQLEFNTFPTVQMIQQQYPNYDGSIHQFVCHDVHELTGTQS